MCILEPDGRILYGFLFKNDFNEFVYTCNRCDEEFRIGQDLEYHTIGHDVKLEDEILDTPDLAPIEVIPQPALSDNGQAQPLLIELPKVEENAETDEPDDAESMELLDDDFTPFQADESSSDDEFLTPNIKIKKFPERKKSKTEKSTKTSTRSNEDRGKLGTFECDICGRVLTSLIRIRKHMTTIHTNKVSECKLCGKQVLTMKRHLRLCHLRPFKCNYCNATYKEKINRDIHVRRHTGEKPFVCHLCGRSYRVKISLKFHMKRKHSKSPERPNAVERAFQCDYCDARYTDEVERDLHVRCHTDEKPFKLDQCDPDDAESGPLDEDFTPFQADDLSSDDAFLTPNTKVKPKTEELANKSAKSKEYRGKLGNFECDICGMVLTSLIRIRKHMTTIHAPKELECKLCGKQVQYMKQHLRLCHSSEQYKCDQCDAKFMKKTDWINHARIHTGEHPFVCHLCGRGFRAKLSLNSHMKRKHPNLRLYAVKRPFNCGYCDAKFTEKVQRDNHSRLHTDKGKLGTFECDICGRILTSLIRIRKHMTAIHVAKQAPAKKTECKLCGRHIRYMKEHLQKFHLSERPFKCDQCDAKFKSKTVRNNHIRLHTGEKPYVCHLCGRCYHASSALNSHMRRSHPHLNPNAVQRPFKCDYCDARYTEKVQRDNHARRHTGEKPFVCEECGRGFHAQQYLTVHTKRHHLRLKPHKCDQCDKSYFRPYQLRDHINFQHLNKKMFRCEICERQFGSRKLLRTHSRSHGEQRHQCIVCHQKFATLDAQKKHETQKHGII